MATRTTKKKQTKAAASGIRINLPDHELLRPALMPARALQREAMRWSYALRNRERWNTQGDAERTQREAMRALAVKLGFSAEHFARIAECGLVEVDIPWSTEDAGWELRIFPWEYMLAAATRDLRRGRNLTVVRHLRTADPAEDMTPRSWLQVVSAPGRLAGDYDFTAERALFRQCVELLKQKFEFLDDPDRDTLRERIAGAKPDVIHIAGFDSHQGLALLDRRGVDGIDGYLLRASRSSASTGEAAVEVVAAQALADLLVPSRTHAPALVAFNIQHSAARLAPLCVANGAAAAIGFQDSFDDALAELFFSTFYRAWQFSGWKFAPAFQFAWQAVREQRGPLQGTGIVLWSRQSILGRRPAPRRAAAVETIGEKWSRTSRPLRTDEEARDALEVRATAYPTLNYSILHNNGPLFETFMVRKKELAVGRVEDLMVSVELHVGTDSFPFRGRTEILETAAHVDLRDAVRISLASVLSRGIRESLRTSLYVEVKWREAVLYRQTHRVTLLPVDEWCYDAGNYRWLPSFVLPRDPAVLRVVDSAQRYLMALRDDATAGFDGYQCVDAQGAMRPKDCQLVDMQVRALWSALLYEVPLSYINPPPSFTDSSQRLRTPSDCVDGKRGTCIDLALLLAACLEYVEIYPAIVLLRSHAFPAYWRHHSFHTEFVKALGDTRGGGAARARAPQSARGQAYAWDLTPDQYREVLGEMQAGRLVPLETTLVTGRGSFTKAMGDGMENMLGKREFESMLDIALARTDREMSVTPLPIIRGEV